MIKKMKYLLLTFVFMLCMIPNVNAEVKTFNLTAANIYNTSTGTYYTSFVENRIDSIVFKGLNTYAANSRQLYHLEGFNQLDYNKNYYLNFWIYVGNLTYGTIPIEKRYTTAPLVWVNGLTCLVRPFGYNTSDGSPDSYYLSGTYNVVCDNFKPSQNAYDFHVWTVKDSNLTSTNTFFGISKNFEVIEVNGELSDILESNEKIEKGVNDLNDNITSSDTTDSQNQANSFFENFDTNDYGLSDIITMPLQLIRTLTNNSCMPLSLTIPFVDKTFNLPCMSSIYQQYFGNFYSLYQTIIFGFVSYWVIVRIFNLVKDFKNPDHDEIEVLDL